jgi:hypothetical protein
MVPEKSFLVLYMMKQAATEHGYPDFYKYLNGSREESYDEQLDKETVSLD